MTHSVIYICIYIYLLTTELLNVLSIRMTYYFRPYGWLDMIWSRGQYFLVIAFIFAIGYKHTIVHHIRSVVKMKSLNTYQTTLIQFLTLWHGLGINVLFRLYMYWNDNLGRHWNRCDSSNHNGDQWVGYWGVNKWLKSTFIQKLEY